MPGKHTIYSICYGYNEKNMSKQKYIKDAIAEKLKRDGFLSEWWYDRLCASSEQGKIVVYFYHLYILRAENIYISLCYKCYVYYKFELYIDIGYYCIFLQRVNLLSGKNIHFLEVSPNVFVSLSERQMFS